MKKTFFLLSILYTLSCCAFPLHAKKFKLAYPGYKGVVDYQTYGTFEGIGTDSYKYRITNRHGLKLVSGEGVYPDWDSINKDPAYRRLRREGRIKGHHWSHVDSGDPLADFFVWVKAPEERGVKQFFIAQALEEMGLFLQAVKAYYAVVVFFPRSPCWGADQSFVWYVGPEAIQRINRILIKHPEWGLTLIDAEIIITNSNDTNISNDRVKVNQGKFIEISRHGTDGQKKDLSGLKVINRRGKGLVKIIQYENGHWQMRVNDRPFIVKGISYTPTLVGLGPTERHGWMFEDSNENGAIDAPYDSWVDKNNNNSRDSDEEIIGDFALLKEMGCNAIRLYHVPTSVGYNPESLNKILLRDLYQRFGIRVIMGDFLGAYTLGSGADWNEGTDYTDPEQRALMKQTVKDLVIDFKDEPCILMWVLGNENNMPADYTGINATRTNASSEPEAYASFLNEVARMIHTLDPQRPVAVGNLEYHLMEYYAEYAQEIDIIAVNSYRGKRGFGSLWEKVKRIFDRPVLILEYGCDAYAQHSGVDEKAQKQYHEGCWEDITVHSAGGNGIGNAIGGVVFEWLDEWWKDTHSGDPYDQHQTVGQFKMPFPDGWNHEEWLGIAGQGDGKNSPFLRHLRKTYYYYKKVWNE